MPKNLRKKHSRSEKSKTKLVPKAERLFVKPRTKDPVYELKGLAKDVWPDSVSSVELVKDIRRRAALEAKQKLRTV
jgi:hypothetical protein